VVVVGVARERPLEQLRFPVRLERVDRLGVERDRAAGALRLRRPERHASASRDKLLVDTGQRSGTA
jgi:hypothetical protein